MNPILWTPDPARVAASTMDAFRHVVAERHGVALPDYAALWRWSVDHPGGVLAPAVGVLRRRAPPGRGDRVLVDGEAMPGATWFPDARLNFAENLLRRSDERRGARLLAARTRSRASA